LSSNFVATPGDALAVIEEYAPGENVYVEESTGLLRSAVPCKVVASYSRRQVDCKAPPKKYEVPRAGSVVYSYVSAVRSDVALLVVFSVEKGKQARVSPFPLAGILHVSQVGRSDVASMYEAVALGDIVRARTLNSENPYQLTIASLDLGVVLSACSLCGAILKLETPAGVLRCPRCRSVEKRAVARSYGNLKFAV